MCRAGEAHFLIRCAVLILNRLCSNSGGTHGIFILNGSPLCHSLELPWLGNIGSKSCIPCGTYPLTKITHPRFSDCFKIDNVPSRSGILIHPGNTLHDTEGCILPGLDVEPGLGVKNSRLALNRLLQYNPMLSTIIIREV